MEFIPHAMLSPEAEFTTQIHLAWQRQLDLGGLFTYAGKLDAAGHRDLAAVLYQTWLSRNDTSAQPFVYFNLGTTLFNANDLDGARSAYLRAVELMPSFIQPHFNLGLIYERLKSPQAALAEWRHVAEHASPDDPDQRGILLQALNNLGRVYENERQYGEALASLTRSLELNPAQPDVLHHWVFLRGKQCEWPVYAEIGGVEPDLMRRSTSALAMISLSDDPQAQLDAARRYVEKKLKTDLPLLTPQHAYKHNKIRIAYLSSDFCLHPVAMLTAELFEMHDRERFEVYGYCWSREDGSPLRARVIDAMDRFERIHDLSDEAAAQLIRDHEIDILIDLQGQTFGARGDLLARRPAPVQITYLGLPATTGLPFIDYVIADRFLIPEEYAPFYSEKPLYMPDVCQCSDRKRIAAPVPSRAEAGLPEEGFVFCSFNNNYKFNPEMFDTWMNILHRVPGSVLWLLADNPWSEANLRKEADKRGMDPNRLIFAPRVSPEKYLARYAAADLFLDTFPFNAGTTANDALWMSLPVLTRSGRSFASRMAGALLSAGGLDSLITYDRDAYEERAVTLANAPDECRALRAKLGEARARGTLFDTERFARNLEDHFVRLVGELG